MNRVEVKENGIVGDYFSESSEQLRPAIIMLGGSEGGKSWSRVKKPIQSLVQRGFKVLSLAYFKAEGLPASLELIPLEYFASAFDWLSQQEGVIPDANAIIGGSKGAEAALLLASIFPQVKAVIAFSPSSVIWQGIPKYRWDLGKDPRSSWSYQGEAIPYLSYLTPISKWEILTLQLRNLHEMSLRANANDEDPIIQLDTLQAALLLISGRRDRLWPSTPMAEQIVLSLKEKGFGLPYEHIALDSGHNGLVMNRDVWRRVFRFLEDNFCEEATRSTAFGFEMCKERK